MLPILTLKKLFKVEIFRLSLKDSSNVTKVFLQYKIIDPNMSAENLYFMRFYSICPGDLVTCIYEREGDSICIRETSGKR